MELLNNTPSSLFWSQVGPGISFERLHHSFPAALHGIHHFLTCILYICMTLFSYFRYIMYTFSTLLLWQERT